MNISSLLKDAGTVKSDEFEKTLESSIDLLRREKGKIGNLTISGRLVEVEPLGEALVIGDLHGDIDSLQHILENNTIIEKLGGDKDAVLIFLGDYGDRGANSVEVYYMILKLKIAFPKQVVLLRGNHEGPDDLQASPHDLPLQFKVRFKENWRPTYSKVRELFNCLYNAVIVEERFLMVHGGLTPNINNFQDLAYAHKVHPEKELLEDLLWSDPSDKVQHVLRSPRGAGRLFGKSVTEKVLNSLGVKILIRGHEMCQNGFKISHGGKVLTLFSTKGPTYFNKYGAYLQLPLSKEFNSARQLIQWIQIF